MLTLLSCNRADTFSAELMPTLKDRFPLPETDFEFIEPVLALNTSLFRTRLEMSKKWSEKSGELQGLAAAYKDVVNHLLTQAKLARQANSPQVNDKPFTLSRSIYFFTFSFVSRNPHFLWLRFLNSIYFTLFGRANFVRDANSRFRRLAGVFQTRPRC